MAVPTSTQFELFEAICIWRPDEHLLGSLKAITWTLRQTNANERVAPPELYDVLLAFHEKKKEFHAVLDAHPVFQWLSKDRNGDAAFRSLSTRRRRRAFSSTQQFVAQRVEYVARYPSSIYRLYVNDPYGESIAGVIRAFYDYFYTERYRLIVAGCRDFNAVRIATLGAAKRLHQNLQTLSYLDETHFPPRPPQAGPSVLKNFTRLMDNIQALVDPSRRVFPSTRLDAKARERILAYDLATALRRFFGRDKPAAVAHFMMVEGVRNPLDKRTIERLLSEWKKARATARSASSATVRHIS